MNASSIIAIVPVKPLTACKTRLAPILSPKERELLGRGFLNHTLGVLKNASCISSIVVVSPDGAALEIAAAAAVHPLHESGQPDMNSAIGQGARYAMGVGADALLVVPTDLPLLTSDDVEQFSSLSLSGAANMVLAPDRHDAGTNLLYLRPPSSDLFRFGSDSLNAYQSLAMKRQIPLHILRSATLALDVDTPSDFQEWRRRAGHSWREKAAI